MDLESHNLGLRNSKNKKKKNKHAPSAYVIFSKEQNFLASTLSAELVCSIGSQRHQTVQIAGKMQSITSTTMKNFKFNKSCTRYRITSTI